ncbi:MAG: hypothetical protein LBT80_00370 [Lactobacillaceae bacterium]|nr:hypothetical protein [Lactobacillaceae bacterium]
MKYGEALRLLRRDKKISAEHLGGDRLTKSFIGKFERGVSQIEFTNLLYILNRMDVGVEEFLSIANDHEIYWDFPKWTSTVNEAIIKSDFTKLGELAAEQLALYTQDKLKPNLVNAYVLQAVIADLQNEEAASETVDYVLNALFENSIWTKYEIFILSLISKFLKPESIKLFGDELTREALNAKLDTTDQQNMARAILNLVRALIENQELSLAQDFLQLVDQLLAKKRMFYVETHALFVKGMLEIAKGHVVNGNQMTSDAIFIFRRLGEPTIADVRQEYLDDFKKRVIYDTF